MKIVLRSAEGPKRGRTITESPHMKCLGGKVESPNLVKLISCKAKDIGKPKLFIQKHVDKTVLMKTKMTIKGDNRHMVFIYYI